MPNISLRVQELWNQVSIIRWYKRIIWRFDKLTNPCNFMYQRTMNRRPKSTVHSFYIPMIIEDACHWMSCYVRMFLRVKAEMWLFGLTWWRSNKALQQPSSLVSKSKDEKNISYLKHSILLSDCMLFDPCNMKNSHRMSIKLFLFFKPDIWAFTQFSWQIPQTNWFMNENLVNINIYAACKYQLAWWGRYTEGLHPQTYCINIYIARWTIYK